VPSREVLIEWGARLGYAARGIIFIMIGGFAGLAALGGRSQAVGTKGALETLLSQPFGLAILSLLAAGLICFSGWRVIQSIFDTDNCGKDAEGIMRRVALLGGAVGNLALAALTLSVATSARSIGDEDSVARDWTAWLLSKPFGQLVVMLIGAAIAVAGILFVWKAIQAKFREQIAADFGHRRWIVALGQFGYVARGGVFFLVGAFLVIAAWRFNSGEAAGIAGALRTLRGQPYGPVLLGVTGLGLFSYGTFEIVQTFARRLNARAVTKSA
jgi:uncharacterized protein DUF1206